MVTMRFSWMRCSWRSDKREGALRAPMCGHRTRRGQGLSAGTLSGGYEAATDQETPDTVSVRMREGARTEVLRKGAGGAFKTMCVTLVCTTPDVSEEEVRSESGFERRVPERARREVSERG